MTPRSRGGWQPDSRASIGCAECEERLADFLDGALHFERQAEVKSHLARCHACAEFARDAQSAMALAARAAEVEVPAALVEQILAEMTRGPSRVLVQASLAERIFGRWIRPVLEPRFALGLAMALLSIAVIPRDWRPPTPAKLWTMAENRVYRVFDRAVKNYEDLALVADVQDQIAGMRDQIGEWRDGERLTDGANAAGERVGER